MILSKDPISTKSQKVRSVLGPPLWNIMYDGSLQLKFPRTVTPVAFADSIALIVERKYFKDILHSFSDTTEKFCE